MTATAEPKKKAKAPQLLTEIERQQAVLDELPPDYQFPLFDGRQAIESQRQSSYEIVRGPRDHRQRP